MNKLESKYTNLEFKQFIFSKYLSNNVNLILTKIGEGNAKFMLII